MSKGKKRLIYALLFFALLAIEVFIAVFVHDRFIRPYVGDVLVVLVVYCFVRIFLPEGMQLLPLYVFIFAAMVEIIQIFDFAGYLGIENKILRTIMGSVFDWKDLACYAVGCAIIVWVERLRHKK